MLIVSHLAKVSPDVVNNRHVAGCVPVYEMWRCEFAALYKSASEQGRNHMANRSFAIGATNVNGFPRQLDMLEEQANPLQTRLDHGL